MNIKILNSLTNETKKRSEILTIGTHNGIFHSDEVVACAILCLINSNMSIHILRSRDNAMLNLCNICVDIGGEKYDHHQAGFNKARKNKVCKCRSYLERFWKSTYRKILIKVF